LVVIEVLHEQQGFHARTTAAAPAAPVQGNEGRQGDYQDCPLANPYLPTGSHLLPECTDQWMQRAPPLLSVFELVWKRKMVVLFPISSPGFLGPAF